MLRRTNVCLVLFLVAILASGCATKRQSGELLGGLGVAALGSQFGGGSGKVFMTGLGAITGIMAGSEIGASLDRADEAYAQQAMERAMNSGQHTRWENRRSGKSGTFTPMRHQAYRDYNTGSTCIPYTFTVIQPDGRRYQGQGQACEG